MATVEEVKAGVARFGDETARQVQAMRAVAQSLDQAAGMLNAVTQGSNHPRVAEALARVEQVKQKLHEAAQIAGGAVESTRTYAAGL
jgi:small-conductance mechanosensitive channel